MRLKSQLSGSHREPLAAAYHLARVSACKSSVLCVYILARISRCQPILREAIFCFTDDTLWSQTEIAAIFSTMTILPRTVSEYIVTNPSAMIQMNSIIVSAFFLGASHIPIGSREHFTQLSYIQGVLTLLTLTTVFFLMYLIFLYLTCYTSNTYCDSYRRNRLSRTSTRIQLVAAAILYTSTCVFFATSLPLYVNSYAWYISNEVSPLNPLSMANWSEDVQRAQSLTLTATLTINVSCRRRV